MEPHEVMGTEFMMDNDLPILSRQISSMRVTNSVTHNSSFQKYDIYDITDFGLYVNVFENNTYLCESKLI